MLEIWIDACTKGIGIYGHTLNGYITIAEPIPKTTCNQAEYKALIRCLNYLAIRKIKDVQIYSDSEIVVRQMNGRYGCKSEGMRPLMEEAKDLLQYFNTINITHIPRAKNKIADKLSKIGGMLYEDTK